MWCLSILSRSVLNFGSFWVCNCNYMRFTVGEPFVHACAPTTSVNIVFSPEVSGFECPCCVAVCVTPQRCQSAGGIRRELCVHWKQPSFKWCLMCRLSVPFLQHSLIEKLFFFFFIYFAPQFCSCSAGDTSGPTFFNDLEKSRKIIKGGKTGVEEMCGRSDIFFHPWLLEA